jgi:hypothetical protein
MSHTPGPWHTDAVGDEAWILDENGNYLMQEIRSDEAGLFIANEREREANMILASAAPELLAALKNRHGDCPCLRPRSEPCTAQEAIMKAEGLL